MNKKLLVVTSYPEKGESHSRSTVGGASYTKKLLEPLAFNSHKSSITVLSELHKNASEYRENWISIKPTWKRNSLSYIFQLMKELIVRKERIKVLSLEVYMFGSLVYLPFVLLAFGLSRLLGSKTVVIMHQVPMQASQFGLNRLFSRIADLLKNIYYKVIQACFTKIVVFEQALAAPFSNITKVEVLPHIVFDEMFPTKKVARKKLGLVKRQKYVLFFGYLAPYKGIDTLINLWPTDSQEVLLVAGDLNPNHKGNSKIVAFRKNLLGLAKGKKIVFTGFVPEELITSYFAAVDAVVMPYRTFMSSSGPLSFAIAAKKPIVMSDSLMPYLKSNTFKDAVSVANLKIDEMFFKQNSQSLQSVMKKAMDAKKKYEIFSGKLRQSRSSKNITQSFASMLEKL